MYLRNIRRKIISHRFRSCTRLIQSFKYVLGIDRVLRRVDTLKYVRTYSRNVRLQACYVIIHNMVHLPTERNRNDDEALSRWNRDMRSRVSKHFHRRLYAYMLANVIFWTIRKEGMDGSLGIRNARGSRKGTSVADEFHSISRRIRRVTEETDEAPKQRSRISRYHVDSETLV